MYEFSWAGWLRVRPRYCKIHVRQRTAFSLTRFWHFLLVSPAQEHVEGFEWWTDYQPVSYILTSKRGNEAQYKAMIDTCHAAGVKVIAGQSKPREREKRKTSDGFVDTIWNHMTSDESGVGVAGSSSFNPLCYVFSPFCS